MSKELKPLVFSINDLAYVDEIMVKKNFDNPHDHAVYKATEVDKVLAQKDFEIDRLKEFNAFLKQRVSNGDVDCSTLLDDLEQKDKEITKLKEQYKDMDVTHTVHIAKMNAKIEELEVNERRLKRALWLARAERAHLKVLEYWPDYCHNAHCRIAEQKWDKVERKCRAMAEKFGG